MVQLQHRPSPRVDTVARAAVRPDLTVVAPPPDLEVRLYSPRVDVVVVRVSGAVDERSAGLLGERVGQQLDRAAHIVLDLAEVAVLQNCGGRVLADMSREATRCGACLHIAGVEDPSVRDQLHRCDLDSAPCVESVVALLPARPPRRRRGRPTGRA